MLSVAPAAPVVRPDDHRRDVDRLLIELSSAYPENLVTGILVDDVPPVVAFERGPRTVKVSAVQLDDQPHVRPEEVRVEPVQRVVGERLRQAGGADQPEHRPFSAGAGAAGAAGLAKDRLD